MYNLLVVDDEKIAVKGITSGIDWSELFDEIYEAMDVSSAKKILVSHKIDVLIADIEMPDENGLELQKWVRENSPYTETIFLTGHSDFKYAQQAMRLGGFDYLLKPLDHDVLKEMVDKALKKVKSELEHSELYEIYQNYYKQWISTTTLECITM